MLKKGLAILLTAVTIFTSGVVTQPVSVQASVFAKTESNSGATNLKECLERTDMNVIHSLETNKSWRDESIQYIKGLKFDGKAPFYKEHSLDKNGVEFTEKYGYFDITNPTVELASKIAYKLNKKYPVHLYAKNKVFIDKLEEISYLISQVNNDGVSLYSYIEKVDNKVDGWDWIIKSMSYKPTDEELEKYYNSASAGDDYFDIKGYSSVYLDKDDEYGFYYIRCLVSYFKKNGVDLMSLSELARYEIISELIENNMIHDDITDYSKFGVKQVRSKKVKSASHNANSFYRLYQYFVLSPEIKYLNHGVCHDYAVLKSKLANCLGLDVRYISCHAMEHAWIVAKLKNSAGKEMFIVDDYGIKTGYGYKDNDLKSDGMWAICADDSNTFEAEVSNYITYLTEATKYEEGSLKATRAIAYPDIKVPSGQYLLTDYNDVFKIRTCGILDAAWQKCRVEFSRQNYMNNFDKNNPANMFMDENGHYHYRYTDVRDADGNIIDSIEDPNYLAEWAAYVDYMQSKNN